MSVFVPPILCANLRVYVIVLRLINDCGPPKMGRAFGKNFHFSNKDKKQVTYFSWTYRVKDRLVLNIYV